MYKYRISPNSSSHPFLWYFGYIENQTIEQVRAAEKLAQNDNAPKDAISVDNNGVWKQFTDSTDINEMRAMKIQAPELFQHAFEIASVSGKDEFTAIASKIA